MQNPAALIPFVCLSAALLATPAELQAQGVRVTQTLEAFHSPSGIAVAADGRTVYVANAARGEFGMLAGRGAISRLKLEDDGNLVVDEARLVEGLNAPLGLAILPRAVANWPEGALVTAVGSLWTVDSRGNQVSDERERGAGLAVIDPESAGIAGRIYLGPGSLLQPVLGHPMVNPLALAIDPEGNIYLADSYGGGVQRIPRDQGRPGILKLSPAALDALSRDETPAPGTFWFAPVPNMPASVYYSTRDDMLYWSTADGLGDLGGAIFRVKGGDFTGASRLETFLKGAEPIVSLTQTPEGTLLAGYSSGKIYYIRNVNRPHEIRFYRQGRRFLDPGQMAVIPGPENKLLVAVPELSGGTRAPWRQRVQVFGLPGDF